MVLENISYYKNYVIANTLRVHFSFFALNLLINMFFASEWSSWSCYECGTYGLQKRQRTCNGCTGNSWEERTSKNGDCCTSKL